MTTHPNTLAAVVSAAQAARMPCPDCKGEGFMMRDLAQCGTGSGVVQEFCNRCGPDNTIAPYQEIATALTVPCGLHSTICPSAPCHECGEPLNGTPGRVLPRLDSMATPAQQDAMTEGLLRLGCKAQGWLGGADSSWKYKELWNVQIVTRDSLGNYGTTLRTGPTRTAALAAAMVAAMGGTG